ncbi:guanylate cyclase, partial [Streptomyces sp. NPDC088785]
MTRVPGQPAPPAGAGARADAADAEHDLRTLFGRSSAVFASLAGPAHMLETANAAFFTAIGGPERTRTGLPIGQLMPELVEQGFVALLDRVYRTGTPYTAREARVVLGVGAQAREAFFDFTYEPRV